MQQAFVFKYPTQRDWGVGTSECATRRWCLRHHVVTHDLCSENGCRAISGSQEASHLLRLLVDKWTMAPNLAASTHALIQDMILDDFTGAQIARVASYRPSSVRRIRSNLECFGSTKAPSNGVGRPRIVTPLMLTALCSRLADKPNMY